MRKSDKEEKVGGAILVPLIPNGLSRRFKRESKRELGENIVSILKLETKRIYNVLIFLVILNMLFMTLLTCTAYPGDQDVNIVNLIQCENETSVLHPKVEIGPAFSSNQVKGVASSTIANAVGMDYFVSRYQLVDVKYDDIDNTYIINYDYTADTGDTVEMRMIIDAENGNPLPPYWQKILLEPQKVMVSENDAEKIAFEVGITSNIMSRLDLLPQYPNFKKLVWIVSQAPSESTLPDDNRTAYIDAENSELIMVEKFGYYAFNNFNSGINSSKKSELELPNNTGLGETLKTTSDRDIYNTSFTASNATSYPEAGPSAAKLGPSITRVYVEDVNGNEKTKVEIGSSFYFLVDVFNSNLISSTYVDIELTCPGIGSWYGTNEKIDALQTRKFWYGPFTRSVAGTYTVSAKVWKSSDGFLLDQKEKDFYVVFSPSITDYLGKDCCGYWPFDTCIHNPEDPDILAHAADIVSGCSDSFYAALDIFTWVSTHIVYDINESKRTPDIVLLVDIKDHGIARGTCSDYADLYIGLARAVNIPSRVISGAQHPVLDPTWIDTFPDYCGLTLSREWHMWAESYISGSWVHVDPADKEYDNPRCYVTNGYTHVIARACTLSPGDCSDCTTDCKNAVDLSSGYVDVTKGQQDITYDPSDIFCYYGSWTNDPANPCKERRDIYRCSHGSNSCLVDGYEYKNKTDGTDCGSDYYGDWVYYCSGDGDTVMRHKQYHDYYCEGGLCVDHTSWKDDQLMEICSNNDGWVDTGNTRWVEANECKEKEQKERVFHDYACSNGACTYSVTDTQWLDTGNTRNKPDGTDCGSDGWVDTGNTQWVEANECKEKEQKERVFHDYACSNGACTCSVTDTQWLDTGTTQNKPDGTDCGCTASNTLKTCKTGSCTDTGICNSTNCDADVACDGKEPGDSCGAGGVCSSTCKCIVSCGNMDVDPTSWSTTLNCGESDSQIVTVSTTGGTVEGVTVSKISGPTWLSVRPTDLGDIASGSSKTFTMTASPPSETSGDCPYSVRVSNTCGTPSTRDVTGTITVYCPELSYFPASHDFGDMCEGETDSTTLEVWNSGTGTLTYSLSESCGWVDVHPTGGSSTDEHDTITVDIDTTGLSEGSHTCDISISSNGGSGTFTVTVNVVPCECDGTDTSCGIYPNCENCNEQDGCYPYGDGCEERDYYCTNNEEGCDYTYSNRHTDDWVDTGNKKWVPYPGNECKEKEQKEQEFRDYACSNGACTSCVTDTQWVDTGNTRNKPEGTICGCTASNTLKRCYSGVCTDTGICDSSCGADAACDGKEPGDSCGGGTCDSNCKCGGTPMDDIAITRDYGGMLVWHVDTDRDGSTDLIFSYGAAGDRAVVGDIG